MRKPLFAILLIIFGMVFPLRAEATDKKASFFSHYFIKQIGAQQGLTNSSITAIHTDSDGYVWIGTKYLLNKYTNGKLISYNSEQTGGSYISMLFEESDETMWVGTESSLSRYDRETDEFTVISPGRINCALEYKGKCYFAGKGDIIVYDTKDTGISSIQIMSSQIIESFVVADDILLFVDRTGMMYFYNVASNSLDQFYVPEIAGSNITCACFDASSLYLGVYFKGVYQIDMGGNILHKYLSKDYPKLRLEIVNDIKKIGSRIWLATDGSGVCAIEDDDIVPLSQIPQYQEISGVPTMTSFISEDKYSNIWIGSTRDGLFGIKPTRILCSNDYIDLSRKDGHNSAILSMTKAEDGLWLGTEGGLFKYSPGTHTFIQEENCKHDIITSLVRLRGDELLISSYCKGLFVLNTRTKAKTPFVILDQEVNKREIMSGYDLNLTKLSDDEILILGEKIYRYNLNTGNTVCLTSDFGVSVAGLRTLHVSMDMGTAYAYSSENLYLMDLVGNRVTLMHSPDISGDISSADYFKGSIYYGTDSGLYRYDIEKDSDNEIYQGLFNRITYLCRKGEYALWVATGNELFSIDTESHIIHIYDEAEGYSTKGVQVSELVDGYYYFGGIDNLSAVPADISGSIENAPSISMYGVLVDGHTVPVENGRIKIPHDHKRVDIQFTSRGSDPFRKTMFKYSISGSESRNVETYDNNFSLSRLSHGNYSVSASYHSSDGFWSTPVQSLSIHVSKPFWQREWVIASIIALLSLIAFFFVYLNSRKAEQALQSAILENKIIEKEKRFRFISSIEAEVATPLSQISKESKALLEEEDASVEKQRKRIEKIYSRSMYLEKMIDVAIRQERPEKGDNPIINKMDEIIDSRISDPNLDVSILVHEMAMSRTALYDKIKELTGMGVNEYIQNRRLVKARKMLIDTQLSIAEIADEVGFSSSKYFSEIFKKAFESSPREFRKRITV